MMTNQHTTIFLNFPNTISTQSHSQRREQKLKVSFIETITDYIFRWKILLLQVRMVLLFIF
jgi:hypothetical protein